MNCHSCTTLILINIFNKRNTFKTNLVQINNRTIMVSNENLDAKCSVQMVVTMPTCGWTARILKVSGENGCVKPNLALKARRGFVIAELLVPVTLIVPSKTNKETIKKWTSSDCAYIFFTSNKYISFAKIVISKFNQKPILAFKIFSRSWEIYSHDFTKCLTKHQN